VVIVENILLSEMYRIYKNLDFFGSEKWLFNKIFGFGYKMHRIYCNSKNWRFVENILLPKMYRIWS
jgi:hypothetical protein